jgi:hypothetical protein
MFYLLDSEGAAARPDDQAFAAKGRWQIASVDESQQITEIMIGVLLSLA